MRSPRSRPGRRMVPAAVLGAVLLASELPYHAKEGPLPPPETFFHAGRSAGRLWRDAPAGAVATIGDSHVMADVVPGVVEEALGRPVRNVPVEGRHPALGLEWLRMAEASPALVVIDVSPMRFAEPTEHPEQTTRFRVALEGPGSWSEAREVLESEAAIGLARLFPSSRRRLEPDRLGRAARRLTEGRIDAFVYEFYGLPVRQEMAESNGFVNLVAVEYPEGYEDVPEALAAGAVDSIRLHHPWRFEYLERLVAALDAWPDPATRFALVRCPLAAPLRAIDDELNADFYRALFDRMAARKIPIYDPPGFGDPADFVDGHHLWAAAAARWSAALAGDLGHALSIDPGAAAAALARAMAASDPAAALADLDEAIARDPWLAEAANARGFARLRLGDPAGAAADFTRAHAIEPTDPSPLVNRAQARLETGDREAAAADLERALAIAPPNWPHRRRVEEMLERTRRR